MVEFLPTLWAGAVRKDMPVRRYLLPASSWARFQRRDGSIRPANLPTPIVDCAIDPGAFEAARRGAYDYDFSQYLRWLFTFQPGQIEWAGIPDYCCVFHTQLMPEYLRRSWYFDLADGDFVRVQQLRTTFLAHMVWSCHRQVPWMWSPCVQGLTCDQYVRHAEDLRNLILAMKWYYGPNSPFRAGIGSLSRGLHPQALLDIVLAVSDVLPGVRFHLYGIKLKTFQTMRYALPECVLSTDSTEWHGLRKRVPASTTEGSVPAGEEGASYPVQGPKKPLPKAWQASGKSQMAYAYQTGLPAYERAIDAALGKIRPTMLPFHIRPQLDAMPLAADDELYQEFRRLIDEERREVVDRSRSRDFFWHFEEPSGAIDWFLP